MSKASEEALSELHGEVARALTKIVQASDEAGNPLVSAAHLAAAIGFLKNNNVTADPASNQGLSELDAALKRKRSENKGRINQRELAAAALQLERDLPGFMQ